MEKVLKLEVKNNIPEFKKFISGKVRKQIPFASAMAINQTLGIGRGFKDKGLDREMAKQMEAKLENPRPQTKRAFFRRFANKKTLTGVLGFVEWANEFMQYQVFGGMRTTGKNIPVPFEKNISLNKFGNIPGKRKGLIKKQNQFFADIGGVEGVYERHKNRTIKLLIGFEKSVNYEIKFPFFKIAENYSMNMYPRNFTKQFNKAIKSAK
tara:strand:+ start:10803 stop:11429 length:627 start_codon:yes stop_codon:yes gene_type:complete